MKTDSEIILELEIHIQDLTNSAVIHTKKLVGANLEIERLKIERNIVKKHIRGEST
tara:strand:- start:5555 stop:5722 length:168 start_codon:yes stop_codon:yes gene_type:complete